MKRDLTVLLIVAVLAGAGVVLFITLRDDEPSAVEKVEQAMREAFGAEEASCDQRAEHRFSCRATRRGGEVELCRLTTDSDDLVSEVSCSAARDR
jgi:hypothetical protein